MALLHKFNEFCEDYLRKVNFDLIYSDIHDKDIYCPTVLYELSLCLLFLTMETDISSFRVGELQSYVGTFGDKEELDKINKIKLLFMVARLEWLYVNPLSIHHGVYT